jgi:hypothetical protein
VNTAQAFSKFVRDVLSLKSLEAGLEAHLVEHNVSEYVRFFPMVGRPFTFDRTNATPHDVVAEVRDAWEESFRLLYKCLDEDVRGAVLRVVKTLANAQLRAEDILVPDWVAFDTGKDFQCRGMGAKIYGLTYTHWNRDVFRAFTAPEFGQFRDTTISITPPDMDAFLTQGSQEWMKTMHGGEEKG